MEVPAPDPTKLLQSWMEWERGEVTPGRVMANMKTGGMRLLLEELAAGGAAAAGPSNPGPSNPGLSNPGLSNPGLSNPGSSKSGEAPGTAGEPSTWAPVV
jgi:hypothetical protein